LLHIEFNVTSGHGFGTFYFSLLGLAVNKNYNRALEKISQHKEEANGSEGSYEKLVILEMTL